MAFYRSIAAANVDLNSDYHFRCLPDLWLCIELLTSLLSGLCLTVARG